MNYLKKGLVLFAFLLCVSHLSSQCSTSSVANNLLVNGDFETPGAPFTTFGAAYQTPGPPTDPQFATYENSLSSFMTEGQFFPGVSGFFQDVPVGPGEEVTVGYWMAYNACNTLVDGDFAFVSLEFVDAGGVVISTLASPNLDNSYPNDEFNLFQVTGITPAGTAAVRINAVHIHFNSSGAVNYDNGFVILGNTITFDEVVETVDPVIACGVAGQNLISSNNNFASDLSGWNQFTEFGTGFNVQYDAGQQAASIFGGFLYPISNIAAISYGSPVSASAGEVFEVCMDMWSLSSDFISGDNFAFVELQFLDGTGAIIGTVQSEQLTNDSSPDTPQTYCVSGVVPVGASAVTVAGVFDQMGCAGGSVKFDNAVIRQVSDFVEAIEFIASPGDCEINLQGRLPLPVAYDNCAIASIVTDNVTDVYPLGASTVNWTATDVNGNQAFCSYDINVIEYNNPTSSLNCNDHVYVSADENCSIFFSADMFLEGGPYACYLTSYEVNILIFGNEADQTGNVNGQVVSAGDLVGEHIYEVIDIATGIKCWGSFTIEDKIAPALSCDCEEILTSVDELTGTLDASSPTWTRPFVTGGNCSPSGTGVDVPYQVFEFTIDMDDSATFEEVTFTAPSADSYIALYEGAFDPSDPCANLLAADDDGGVGFLSSITATIEAGITYYLVVTTFNNSGNDFGDFIVDISTVGGANIMTINPDCIFSCTDFLYDLQNEDELEIFIDDILPEPEEPTDGCISNFGDPVMSFEVLDNGCDGILVKRTAKYFYADFSGTVQEIECVQQYLFQSADFNSCGATQLTGIPPTAQPTFDDNGDKFDFYKPLAEVELPCGQGTSPAEIARFFDQNSNSQAGLENDDEEDTPSVIENNEGIVYAYPYYLAVGDRSAPLMDGGLHPQAIDNQICNVFATFADQVIDACQEGCKGNSKVIRTWTLLDWCSGNVNVFEQLIKAVDNEGPQIDVSDFTTSVDPWGCAADIDMPAPEHLHDLCDDQVGYYVLAPAGVTLTGNAVTGYTALAVAKGVHNFTYVGIDCCGNETFRTVRVEVLDQTPPTAIAKQNIVINLAAIAENEGFAKLFAEDVDNASHDQCSDVYFEIRRDSDNCGVVGNSSYNNDGHPEDDMDDPDAGQYVKFCCGDVDGSLVDSITGQAYGMVTVWLRVWDDGDMDGTYGSAGDNYNEVWVDVRVENKNPPVLVCPIDVTLKCDDDHLDFNVTGVAEAFSACGDEEVDYSDRNESGFDEACNVGVIRRTWTAGTSQCIQFITLDYQDTFDETSIEYPSDLQVTCMDFQTGEPSWVDGNCDLVGSTLQSDTFLFEDGACYKVLNHWTVINWCTYNPLDADANFINNEAADADGDGIINLWDDDDNDNGVPDSYYDNPDDDPSKDIRYYLDEEGDLYGINYTDQLVIRGDVVDIWDLILMATDGNFGGEFDPEAEDDGIARGFSRHTQVIVLIDDERPVITAVDTCYGVNDVCLSESVTLSASATDNGACGSPWIKWEVQVDAWNDNTVDYEYSSFVAAEINGEPNDFFLNPTTGSGSFVLPTGNGGVVSVALPDGIPGNCGVEHRVVWKAFDGCGNVTTESSMFTIEDKKAPTPYCINLSTALMENGSVELWATDFDQGSFDNCTDSDYLLYTFSNVVPAQLVDPFETSPYYDENGEVIDRDDYEDGEGEKWNGGIRSSAKVFNCDDLVLASANGGNLPVELYVWDECGNYDFCVVNLKLVDNNDGCSDTGTNTFARISGNVSTESGEGVEGIVMEIMTPENNNYPQNITTDENGDYAFDNTPMYNDYSLTGSKDGDWLNGVSTLDLVLIQKHILGVDNFVSPYQFIAADASNDEKVTAIDLVQIRKLILGIDATYANNHSWRLVNASSQMDINTVWPFTEDLDVYGLDENMYNNNFVGVKIGDVNGNAVANANQITTTNRNAANLEFDMVYAGLNDNGHDIYNVTSSNFKNIWGYQFTLEVSGSLVNIKPAALNMSMTNAAQADKNTINLSWNANTMESFNDGEILFSIVLNSTNQGDAINAINSSLINAEAYRGENLNILDVVLSSQVNVSEYTLNQNEPNPFNESTIINFGLPQSSSIVLTILDINGKVLKTISRDLDKGYHTIQVSQDDLNATSGVYYYRLQAGDFVQTKQMIVVE